MLTLGIETSCDETSVAVVKDPRRILANVAFSSLEEHRRFGGVVPEIASRAQEECIVACLDECLRRARLKLRQVDLVAVTQGPGLIGSLLVGLSAAKALCLGLEKPLVGVDHVLAHGYAAFLDETRLGFPVLGLVVSGGHTVILKMDGASCVRVLGRTLDDAAGEAFDKVAKILGLGYPGGPEIDRLAKNRDADPLFFSRPYLSNDSFNFSFSGIKTAVYYTVQRLKKKRPLTLALKKGIAAGFQEAVCDVLVEKSLRAAEAERLGTIVVGGGVSANSRLRRKFIAAAKDRGIRVVFPRPELTQDNAAMIAGLGAALYKEGKRDTLDLASYSKFESHGNQV